MTQKRVCIPLPSYGFDPTEVAIPWKLISAGDISITFLTPDGQKASADDLMLRGRRLGLLKSTLRARQDAVSAFEEMAGSVSFCQPATYQEAQENHFDALLLPGGHDKGIKEYLESSVLQKLVVDFFQADKPVGAICHGVVLAARSIDPETQQSVLHGYKTTALLKSQELLAYNLTRLWLKDYYLTYPGLTVEDEVTSALQDPANFLRGPRPISRDDMDHLERSFVVQDRNYISARWPGDVYKFSIEFIDLLVR